MPLKDKLEAFIAHMRTLGANPTDCKFDPPASAEAVQQIEAELGYPLPGEFKQILLTVSGHVEFRWFLPDEITLPDALRGVFSGALHWGLEWILPCNQSKDSWISRVFPNSEDPYDRVWHQKFVFQEVGNGDYLSIDLAPDSYGKIIYLSHDDGKGHGYMMAPSFSALLESWTTLGCVGAEDWQWLPFCANATDGIDPDCPNALLWKQTIGINQHDTFLAP